MGLIINKPSRELNFADLLKQLDIEPDAEADGIQVHFGGPVEMGRGFVLHSADYAPSDATMEVTPQFGMTATLDILEDMATGSGPKRAILAMGYAGWGPGQLESEIVANGWLVGDPTYGLVFGSDDPSKWQSALENMGINPLLLSAQGGRA